MNWANVIGLDPSIRNFGIARGRIFVGEGDATRIPMTTGAVLIEKLQLVQTDSQAGKTVRKSSDDLRCAQEIAAVLRREIADHNARFVISEIPSGAQSARAAFLLGAALGLIAAIRVPIIQVSPTETKLASVGVKNASKRQIIEWAAAEFPLAGWLRHKHKGEMVLDAANEHLADAVAVIHAGVKTREFQQAVAIMRSIAA